MIDKVVPLHRVREWLLTDTPTSPFHATAGRSYLIAREFVKNHLAVLGLLIILTLIGVALFAPWLAPFDPVQTNLVNRLQPPSAAHWMGTDEVGRDILSDDSLRARELRGQRNARLPKGRSPVQGPGKCREGSGRRLRI